MGSEARPGMSREAAQKLLPDMIIPETEPINEKGWYHEPHVEDNNKCIARCKDLVKDFKEIYRSNREKYEGKTFVAISHGSFLNTLACTFTNNVPQASLDFFIPENNSVTILDFADVKEGTKEFVDCKLTAFNLKLKKQ